MTIELRSSTASGSQWQSKLLQAMKQIPARSVDSRRIFERRLQRFQDLGQLLRVLLKKHLDREASFLLVAIDAGRNKVVDSVRSTFRPRMNVIEINLRIESNQLLD